MRCARWPVATPINEEQRTMSPKNKHRTIRGRVAIADVDDDERPLAVVLVTDDDDEYLIDPLGKGDQLLDLVDEYLEVKGVVHNDDGDYSISVQTFRLVGGSDFDEHDADEEDP
jgi:hypothetical protein